jgi:Neuraminidase (sialidase)
MIRKILVFLTALFSISQTLSAQVKNSVIDCVEAPPYASLIAINPKDQKNIIAGALPNTIFYSFDEGLTWQKSIIEPAASMTGNAAIVVDTKNNFYYFYLADSAAAKNRIVMQRSEDGGKTWEVNDGLGLELKQNCYQISPYVDASNNLFLTWSQFDKKSSDPDCKSNIFISKSSNKGKKWSDPIQLSQSFGTCLADKMLTGSSPAVVGDQKKFAVWMNEGKIYMDRSYDGKLWLSNDIVVTQHSAPSHEVPNFNNSAGLPIFLSDNGKSFLAGNIYLVSTEKKINEDDIDILFLRSHNGGDSWTSPQRLTGDEPGTLQFKPAMDIDQETGYIYIAYYNQQRANSDETDVFISYSKDGGATFKKIKVNEKSFKPAKNNVSGSYTNLAVYKGTVVAVWAEISEGQTKLNTVTLKQDMFWKK